jgi:starch synthase
MVCALLKTIFRNERTFNKAATVLTIHNISEQGIFDRWNFNFTGLPWNYFNWHYFEFYGKMNLLKAGIAFADKLSALSPAIASQIQTKEFGYSLDELLHSRSEDIVGISFDSEDSPKLFKNLYKAASKKKQETLKS